MARPVGVTIIAVLDILVGIAALFLGVIAIIFGGYAGGLGLGYSGIIAFIGALFGGILIVFALIHFAIAWGFLSGMGWARIVGIIFGALDVLGGLFSLPTGIVELAIGAVIIYYLTRPEVVAWFRHETTPPPPAPTSSQTPTPPTPT